MTAAGWWHVYGRVMTDGPNRGAAHLITYGSSALSPEEAASTHYLSIVRKHNAPDLTYLGSFDHEPTGPETVLLMERTL